MADQINLQAALDTGNHSIKGSVNDVEFQVPSNCVTLLLNQYSAPISFRTKAAEQKYVSNLLDRMEVEISSPTVKETGRLLVGYEANKSGLPVTEFTLNRLFTARNDLTMILNLSILATTAVQHYYKKAGELPTDGLHANVVLVTDLPIVEYSDPTVREDYIRRYTAGKHVVTLRNFVDPITVIINVTQVQVEMESVAAQYALVGLDSETDKLREVVYQQFRQDNSAFSFYSLNDLYDSIKRVTIDIGEKTTDISVLDGIKPNLRLSNSLYSGFGQALDSAIDTLNAQHYQYSSRYQILEELDNWQPNRIEMRIHTAVVNAVAKQPDLLTSNIIKALSKLLENTMETAQIQVIYVVGGGAGPIKKQLFPKIQMLTEAYADGHSTPIVYVPTSFAQRMNLLGLEVILGILTQDAVDTKDAVPHSEKEAAMAADQDFTTTMSAQGQITIPAKLRAELALAPGTRLIIEKGATGQLVLTKRS